MPNWENVMVDTDQMEPGKFYYIYTNKDNATLIIDKSIQDNINAQVDTNKNNVSSILQHNIAQDSKLQALENKDDSYNTIILDNQARINNLEDRDLRREFLAGLDMSSIRAYFEGKTEIKVLYGRKEITNIIVYRQVSITPEEKIYEEITSGISITYHEKYNINDNSLIEKYVLIKANTPVTGYCLIL